MGGLVSGAPYKVTWPTDAKGRFFVPRVGYIAGLSRFVRFEGAIFVTAPGFPKAARAGKQVDVVAAAWRAGAVSAAQAEEWRLHGAGKKFGLKGGQVPWPPA